MKEEGIIESVVKNDDFYSISLENGLCFGLSATYGVEPKVGDSVVLHTVQGSTFRGVELNGTPVFYKSDEQLEQEHKEWCENYQREKEEAFEKNKNEMDEKYNKLPQVFRDRIDCFRANNPKFRVDYEPYEMFCCEQAVLIAEACKTPEMVKEFADKDWAEQKGMVPQLDEGHSGNTFGCSCQLAYWYLNQEDVVVKLHGALAPLVGSEEYGDFPKEEAEVEV